jgi:hypothetical protein
MDILHINETHVADGVSGVSQRQNEVWRANIAMVETTTMKCTDNPEDLFKMVKVVEVGVWHCIPTPLFKNEIGRGLEGNDGKINVAVRYVFDCRWLGCGRCLRGFGF